MFSDSGTNYLTTGKVIKIFILSTLFTFSLAAAHEMAFDQVISFTSIPKSSDKLDISIYISKKSKWDLKEIKKRWEQANIALKSCNTSIENAFIYSWNPSRPLLRVDDYVSSKTYYDGMRYASVKSKKATPMQFFYFKNYLESFTSGPSIPLAIYPDSSLEPDTFNTAWFPYESAQRLKEKNIFRYNEESHEMGHILLGKGHDQSGDLNIMANNSGKRTLNFNKQQCVSIRDYFRARQNLSDKLFPLFSIYYDTYKKDFYMSDWCSRNVNNLAHAYDKIYNISHYDAYAVYVVNKNDGESFYPKKARKRNIGWKFHAFLVINGHVLDLDYSKKPTILTVSEYLNKMFNGDTDKLLFQLRSPLNTPGFTYQEVLKSFKTNKDNVLNSKEFLELF